MGGGASKTEKLWLEKTNRSLKDELDGLKRMESELDMRNVQVSVLGRGLTIGRMLIRNTII
jgi:hypothetical protein